VLEHKEPLYADKNGKLVTTLLNIYDCYTGTKSIPLTTGGGTYARAMDNVVAYGAMFPGDEDLMHQKNECISIDNLMKMTRIYAEAIYRLAADV
jgi:succinyl-diaminopimelate desuccinylase